MCTRIARLSKCQASGFPDFLISSNRTTRQHYTSLAWLEYRRGNFVNEQRLAGSRHANSRSVGLEIHLLWNSEVSLPHWRDPTTEPCIELGESGPHHHILFVSNCGPEILGRKIFQ